MQLKRVVLPAPFGPIRPTISPGSMASETSLLATSPPNRRVHDWRCRSAATPSLFSHGIAHHAGGPGRAAAGQSRAPAPPWKREQPVGPPSRDQHDDGAVDDQVDAA